ncbi:hypothetical protein [Streptomyces sp. NBC_01361]|uniref:hypothetical protein n=1 Tax=Streptomyces sp. NBC_01361 TaxID=2903838 RepID=UPI002E33B951|nr:hypothetical protein [Streptomyces sp. NBC_01361]
MADPKRYRLTLTSAGAVVMQGWWPDLASAERKFTSWIGSYSAIAEVKIVLSERGGENYEAMKQWPDDQA